jgi:glutamine cyclotransferase
MKNVTAFALFLLLAMMGLIACGGAAPAEIATLAPTAAAPAVIAPEQPAEDAAPQQPAEAAAPEATTAPEAGAGEPAGEAAAPTATPEPPTPTTEPTPVPSPTPAAAARYTYRVLNTYPHDPDAFTQGLDIDNGELFEGTGLYGESTLRLVDLTSGSVSRNQPLAQEYFGEGITVLGDKIYQLTWQEGTGFIYDRNTFQQLQTFNYEHEGWGITHDGTRLIVSDGTSTIRFWDPATLQEVGRIDVADEQGPVIMLNELEYLNGEIWANVWMTDLIARINPESGRVTGWIDLTGIFTPQAEDEPNDVLNGIAINEATGQIYVTGKLWSSLFEIEVIRAP